MKLLPPRRAARVIPQGSMPAGQWSLAPGIRS